MVYNTTRQALSVARVERDELDNVVIASSDELDGRSISSMLIGTPAGAYLKDEIKVTDCGAMALPLSAARIASGYFNLGVVASWCKPSKTSVEEVMRKKGDPFYTRPLGVNSAIADGLFSQAVFERWQISEDEVNERVINAYTRAQKNSRGMQWKVPTAGELSRSPSISAPLRQGQRAPLTDGAVAMVLASERWLRQNPGHQSLARLSGLGWATDSYQLDRARLSGMRSASAAWNIALKAAGLKNGGEAQIVELECQHGYFEAALSRAFDIERHLEINPSGGAYAQNPLFCTGLVSMAEAVLQVSNRAGPVQVKNAKRAIAHSCYGFASQGTVVATFEAPEV